jgi:hypothetical protein
MAKNYYYFVSTLPSLAYSDAPPCSAEEFAAECLEHLGKRDAALLKFCTYEPQVVTEATAPTGSRYLDFFLLRERTLVLSLAHLRADRLGRHALPDHYRDMPRTGAVAKTAFEMEDPLEATRYIDQTRWGFLDDIFRLDHLFGATTVFDYLLRLQLMERKRRFDTAAGDERYKEVYDGILQAYHNE